VSTIFNVVQGIFGDISNSNQQQFANQMATKAFNLSKQAQQFNQNMATQNLGMAKKTLTENLQTSGQQRAQGAVTFQQGQQDRTKQQKFLNALSTGIAMGLSKRTSQPLLGQAVPAPQQPAAQPSPYIGRSTQLSSPSLSGAPRS
jgi:hypothetical protein